MCLGNFSTYETSSWNCAIFVSLSALTTGKAESFFWQENKEHEALTILFPSTPTFLDQRKALCDLPIPPQEPAQPLVSPALLAMGERAAGGVLGSMHQQEAERKTHSFPKGIYAFDPGASFVFVWLVFHSCLFVYLRFSKNLESSRPPPLSEKRFRWTTYLHPQCPFL